MSKSKFLRKHPWPVIQMANATNFVKMGRTCAKMAVNGELTGTLWRRWANMDTIITT